MAQGIFTPSIPGNTLMNSNPYLISPISEIPSSPSHPHFSSFQQQNPWTSAWNYSPKRQYLTDSTLTVDRTGWCKERSLLDLHQNMNKTNEYGYLQNESPAKYWNRYNSMITTDQRWKPYLFEYNDERFEKEKCVNCGVVYNSTIRRDNRESKNLCNACGRWKFNDLSKQFLKQHRNSITFNGMFNNFNVQQQQQAPQSFYPADDGYLLTCRPSQFCVNCHTSHTTLWRRNSEGQTVCNACGLYYKLHGIARPMSMRKDGIQTRKRKLKTSQNSNRKESTSIRCKQNYTAGSIIDTMHKDVKSDLNQATEQSYNRADIAHDTPTVITQQSRTSTLTLLPVNPTSLKSSQSAYHSSDLYTSILAPTEMLRDYGSSAKLYALELNPRTAR